MKIVWHPARTGINPGATEQRRMNPAAALVETALAVAVGFSSLLQIPIYTPDSRHQWMDIRHQQKNERTEGLSREQ